MSRAIAMVGATGSGKTFFTRQMLKAGNVNPKACKIFDVNNEWKDYYPQPFNDDLDLFLAQCYNMKNGLILIEDATSFISTRGREDILIKILIGKRHTKNTIIMLFHSFADLPNYIYKKCTHVGIFKTLDSEKYVQNKYDDERLTAAWKRVQKNCESHAFFKSYPPPKGIAPPSEIFSIYS